MNKEIKNITLAAIFLALGLVLPFFTGQIPEIGNMLLPMHIPVFLAGLILGWRYGALLGFILPLLRNFLFGMPPLYPNGLAMALELMTYGLVAGYLYEHSKWQCLRALYRVLIIAMFMGRVVWGLSEIILLGIGNNVFTWQAFVSGALLAAIPGIILQLTLIPLVMVALNKSGLLPFKKSCLS